MRLLLVSPTPPPNGGIATWTNKYIDFFKCSDFEIDLVDTSIIGKREQKMAQKKIIDELKRFVNIIKTTKQYLKNNKYDIVHINTSCSKTGMIRDLMILKLVHKYNIPLILQCHCNIKDQINNNDISLKILKKMCVLSKKILVLNNESKEFLQEIGINSLCFPNFIDDDIIRSNEKQISHEVHNVIFLGHVMKSKGIDELLAASEQFPSIQFNIVGEVHDEYKARKYPKNVNFVGNVNHDKVINYLDESDIFILPSYTEGFSIAVLEAMGRGLPIITTDVGNNKELIQSENGIVVDVKSIDQLVESIRILLDFNTRKVMSEQNIKKANRFTREKVLTHLEKLYKEV